MICEVHEGGALRRWTALFQSPFA